jgi:spore germination cell wall hydrolase CwlJ-like protein
MTTKASNGNPIFWVTLSRNVIQFLAFMLVMSLLWSVTQTKLATLEEGSDVYRQGFVSAEDRTKQLDCLTKNIYNEAATEPFEGKVAVAQVTMNRVDSGKFGKGVCGVVYQKNVIYEKVICQFSWACIPGIAKKTVYPALYKESEEVAKKVLLENFRLPSMTQAMYYHADYVNPKWGKPKITQIGHHIFYKE